MTNVPTHTLCVRDPRVAVSDRNILLVMTDDHGQWCTGTYGNSEVETPTVDYLAASGVRMDNAFSPSPVCSPSRASLFTGLRPSQHGVHDWIHEEKYADRDWLADEVTLPEILGDGGYTTALAGKWHCGPGREQSAFDRSITLQDDAFEGQRFSVQQDRRTTDHALEFLREERDEDAPFFLYVGLVATHWPCRGQPERLVDRYRGSDFPDVIDEPTYRFGRTDILRPEDTDEALAQYYAAAEGVDEQVGRLLDELAVQGLDGETLVVYTGDHGHNCSHHGMWGKGNGTDPPNVLEESIRVPLVLGGHDDVVSPQVRNEFVDHTDTFRTLLDFAGVDPPESVDYPGDSYCRQLTDAGDGTDWEQRQICEYADVRMISDERHKFVRRLPDGPDLLFNLNEDPRETRNVIEDPAYATVVSRLAKQLTAAFERYSTDGKEGVPIDDLPEYNGLEAWDQ